MPYKLQAVSSKKAEKEFLSFPAKLYKDDPNYIRPLDADIKKIFDPKKNKYMTSGKAIRWLLLNDNNEAVGRVAAFVNMHTLHDNDQPTGGMGFFDCINDKEAAFTLFDACKNWLKENGMEAMDGPINLGERDNWWGLLVDGFLPPSYGMNYNAPYYKDLFEAYGFKNYFYQYSYLRPISWDNVSESLKDKAERLAQNPDYRYEYASKKNLKKAAENFCYIYNKAWVQHSSVPPMTVKHAMEMVKKIKPIMDERLIFFTYHKDEPIGFFIQIPEINQAIRYINGKSGIFHLLKMIYLIRRKKVCTRILGLVFGIIPEFRGRGVEGAMVMKFAELAFSKGFQYKDIDLTWVGDFNPAMMRFQQQIGGSIYKTHATYRLLFDAYKQEHEFKRYPRMGKEKQKAE